MIKIVFTYDVPEEKREAHLNATSEVIKPFWESHGCSSYQLWEAETGSPTFLKEMVFDDAAGKNEISRISKEDPEAKKVMSTWRGFVENLTRRVYVRKV